MSYQQEIEAITSLSIDGSSSPNTTEIGYFEADGSKEVVNRIIALRPQESYKFASTSTPSDDGVDIDGQIISVVREHDSATILRSCSKMNPNERYDASQSSSLNYRSDYNPGYYILDGKLYTVPAAVEGTNNGVIVTQVAYPADYSGLPSEYQYLAVLYGAQQALIAYMGSLDAALPSAIVLPVLPSAPSLSDSSISFSTTTEYTAPVISIPAFPSLSWTMPAVPIAPAISSGSVTITGTAPTYTGPVLSMSSFPSLSWVMPSAPVAPALTGATLGELGDIPTYTQPVSAPDFAGIETQIADDDPELAANEISKVGAQLTKYQADIQNALNVFQKENAIYQANLQKDTQAVQIQTGNDGNLIQKYSADITEYSAAVGEIVQANQGQISEWQQENTINIQKYTAEIQNALNKFNEENTEYQALLQKDIQDATLADGEIAKQLQKYSAEIQAYGGEVGAIVQNNQGQVTEWQAEAGVLLQKYTAELTNSTAEFNKTQVEYQGDLQKAIQEAQLVSGDDAQKIQNYGIEVQEYSANVQAVVADFNAALQKEGAKYQWAQARYTAIRQQYNDAFGLMAPAKQKGDK